MPNRSPGTSSSSPSCTSWARATWSACLCWSRGRCSARWPESPGGGASRRPWRSTCDARHGSTRGGDACFRRTSDDRSQRSLVSAARPSGPAPLPATTTPRAEARRGRTPPRLCRRTPARRPRRSDRRWVGGPGGGARPTAAPCRRSGRRPLPGAGVADGVFDLKKVHPSRPFSRVSPAWERREGPPPPSATPRASESRRSPSSNPSERVCHGAGPFRRGPHHQAPRRSPSGWVLRWAAPQPARGTS
jgi:hypothetical protein